MAAPMSTFARFAAISNDTGGRHDCWGALTSSYGWAPTRKKEARQSFLGRVPLIPIKLHFPPLVPKLQFGNLFPEAVASQDLRSQAGAWDRANHRTHGTGSLLHGGSYFLRHRVYRTHDEVSSAGSQTPVWEPFSGSCSFPRSTLPSRSLGSSEPSNAWHRKLASWRILLSSSSSLSNA